MSQGGAACPDNAPKFDLSVDVAVQDERWFDVDGDPTAAVESTVRAVIGTVGLGFGAAFEISVVLGDDGLVQGLNRDFRKQDRPTNVLSFSLTEGEGAPLSRNPGEPVLLGDVVLAFDTVTQEAREQSKSFRDHTLHLVVHGVLHLMGYDHLTEAEARVMERMEQQVLADLGIADPYLERPPLA